MIRGDVVRVTAVHALDAYAKRGRSAEVVGRTFTLKSTPGRHAAAPGFWRDVSMTDGTVFHAVALEPAHARDS